MAVFASSFGDAPVLALSPQTAQQAIELSRAYAPEGSTPLNSMSCATESRFDTPPRRPSAAGRKRSRDEADLNHTEDVVEPTPIEPIKESEEDWIYGEGMVLIKPGAGYVADASSQSGTWVEEKAAAEEEARKAALQRQLDQRPILRSAKSQRREAAAAGSPGKEYSAPSPSPSLSNMDPSCPPVVDDFTLHLGIGWRGISEDEHIQAAARGWAKFIENHYPLTHVTIRLESKGLQSYLVEAAEGYFLFDESLRQGRLVSTTGEGALNNLKHNPPTFDSQETMMAAETPKGTDRTPTPLFTMDTDMEVC